MRILIYCALITTFSGGLLAGLKPPSLNHHQMQNIVGGEICYDEGTKECPSPPTTTCGDTKCEPTGAGGTQECPSGTREITSPREGFDSCVSKKDGDFGGIPHAIPGDDFEGPHALKKDWCWKYGKCKHGPCAMGTELEWWCVSLGQGGVIDCDRGGCFEKSECVEAEIDLCPPEEDDDDEGEGLGHYGPQDPF